MEKIIIPVIVVVVVGIGAFYAGTKYSSAKSLTGARTAGGGGGFANLSPEERQARINELGVAGFVGRGRNGNNSAAGDIIAKDEKSITIKLRDGGSKIVFFSNTTSILKAVEGSVNDLVVGEQVTAQGGVNTDGSISAQSIQIRRTTNAN